MWTRREFLRALVLSAAGVAVGPAMAAAREHGGGGGGGPEGPATPLPAPTRPPHLPDPAEYKKAYLDRNTGHMTCKESGLTCWVVNRAPFVTTSRPTRYHGDELRRYTRELNRIIAEVRSQNRDRGRELAVLMTPYAAFLAWCQLSESAVRNPVSVEDDPQLAYQVLGIARSVAQAEDEMRRLARPTVISVGPGAAPSGTQPGNETSKLSPGGQGAGDMLRPTRNWTSKEGTVICYPSTRPRQTVARLAESDRSTPAHDEALRSATRRINELLSRAAAAPKPEGTELAILRTPVGLFLAWSRNEGPGFTPPPGAVTGDSPADRVVRELGLVLSD